jgi:preprotein translocase subunit SecA
VSASETIRADGVGASAPGLRLARALPYPERASRPEGAAEDWLRHAAAMLPRLPDAWTRRRLAGIAARAGRYADDALRAAEAPAEAAGELRPLLRAGFAPDAVARVFALLRVVSARHLGMTPYDVQLMAAAAMLGGRMAELATGEGKTLSAALTAATAALAGRMVHVVTVNDYLASRDAAQLAPFYRALGLTTGLIVAGQKPAERRAAYARDIVYASNKELVFDYLRDQMRRRATASALHARVARLDGRAGHEDGLVMRGLDFVIVDEADSVLIDEARTPLIISDTVAGEVDHDPCHAAMRLVAGLVEGVDFTVDRSARRIDITRAGQTRVEALSASFGGAWDSTVSRAELVMQALTARLLFSRDEHYLVRDGRVTIIDEYTGRVMPDRFWNEGLHQMIEAKEGCAPSRLRASVARITYQRFFTRYLHLCGMSGTLAEVTRELRTVYSVGVARIPTHHPGRRRIEPTVVVPTAAAKWRAIVERATALAAEGRAVLIGTRSVAASEQASALLRSLGVRHSLLNAAQDAEEASVVARAGMAGGVTIATNMAGRGTDIRLAPGVSERGGLAVILSDRHDAARIDRQLAGRGARQGDRGSFLQVLSLEDALMDPLRTNRLGRLVLAAVGANRLVAGAMFGFMQGRAERRHRMVRRELMRYEARLQASMSFAGRPD